jgi:predicted nucleotidyltransferase
MMRKRHDVPQGSKEKAAMSTIQNRHGHIRQLCARIAQEFKPEKIILFGSHAYGQPTPDSDLDLLVVMQFEGDPLEQAVAILNRLNVLVPIDLLVRTPEQIQQRLAMGDRFMGDIIERGQVMYEAHHA